MKPTWTEKELKEFDRLIELTSSRNQMDRITARIEMPQFINKNGKEKCDAMFDYLESKDK